MDSSQEERRKFPRIAFPCKIVLSSPLRSLTTHTENISEGGIKIIVEEKLSAFTTIGIEIFLEKDKPIKCKGKIMRVTEKVNPVAR